jgi:nicotinate-nucleotide pyrophosphorylase (carboxylating)
LPRDFEQITWDSQLEGDFRHLLHLAIGEDLGTSGDCTTLALVPEGVVGRAALVARQAGVVAGLPGVEMTLAAVDARLRQRPPESDVPRLLAIRDRARAIGGHPQWQPEAVDGTTIEAGQPLGWIEGPAQVILMAERIMLNVLGRLSGIATLTRRYVDAVTGTTARVYDTRKTTPGWRRLEKYAVRCGGGWNHRLGLFAAVLIKDNHLAFGADPATAPAGRYSIAEAVGRARRYSESSAGVRHELLMEYARQMTLAQPTEREPLPPQGENVQPSLPRQLEAILEVEVDRLDQLDEVLRARPDIVLLDNMSPEEIRQALAQRDRLAPHVQLEASGGINLESIRAVAETGVERISVGALTHSAAHLDLGLDWAPGSGQSAVGSR